MKKITINERSVELLAARSLSGNVSGAKKVPGGFEVEVDDEVAASLEFLDQDPNKAIFILCTTGVGKA